jgi:hypothetical protein
MQPRKRASGHFLQKCRFLAELALLKGKTVSVASIGKIVYGGTHCVECDALHRSRDPEQSEPNGHQSIHPEMVEIPQ